MPGTPMPVSLVRGGLEQETGLQPKGAPADRSLIRPWTFTILPPATAYGNMQARWAPQAGVWESERAEPRQGSRSPHRSHGSSGREKALNMRVSFWQSVMLLVDVVLLMTWTVSSQASSSLPLAGTRRKGRNGGPRSLAPCSGLSLSPSIVHLSGVCLAHTEQAALQ